MDDAHVAEEQVLLVVHKHPMAFVREAALVVVPALLVLALLLALRNLPLSVVDVGFRATATLLVSLTMLVVWILLGILWTTHYLDILIVTDRRIIYMDQATIARRAVLSWNIPDVHDASVHTGTLLESFFNYGTLRLRMRTNHEVVDLNSLPDPEYISAIVLRQDDRFGQLKAAAQKQQELLRFVSHEIKGHLAKSKAAFAAIEQGDFGAVPESVKSLAHAGLADTQVGVETVMSILDDRAGKGADAKPAGTFDIAASVQRLVDGSRTEAMHKGLALRALIEPGAIVSGDQQKIEQHVIRNLIDNALHYTPTGQVEVSVKKESGKAIVCVADTGIGIAAGDMQKLFTQGGRGELSRAVNPESTGYGLYIAKQIVEAHGGRIWADSHGPGTGSRFYVELPLSA